MNWNITDQPETEALVDDVFADLLPRLWFRAGQANTKACRTVEVYAVVDRKGYRHRIATPSTEASPYYDPDTVRFGIEIGMGEHQAEDPVSATDTIDGPGVRISLEFDKDHRTGKAIAELIERRHRAALQRRREESLREIEELQRRVRTIDDSLGSADQA